MLCSCLLIALLRTPYWIGVVAAVVVTILEKQAYVDDNITAPLGALAIKAVLTTLI